MPVSMRNLSGHAAQRVAAYSNLVLLFLNLRNLLYFISNLYILLYLIEICETMRKFKGR